MNWRRLAGTLKMLLGILKTVGFALIVVLIVFIEICMFPFGFVGAQEDQLMKSWLTLVNERNGLVRKTAELSLK